MKHPDGSRREILKQVGAVTAGAALGGALGSSEVWAKSPTRSTEDGVGGLNVRKFGAVGDGKTDDTQAFQTAMNAANESGGNIVFVPRGNYLITDRLEVPKHVVLEGVWRAPTARTQNLGSTLLAVAGAGDPDGKPFITLEENSTLNGLTIFYPEQKEQNPPVPYPWTVRGRSDNCSIVNVHIVNPYQAVDFGTVPCGRHFISGLYAQPLYKGLFIDKCFDVGRVENVHFWPFWKDDEGVIKEFMRTQATAFIIGRTDWEYFYNCFSIFYRIGFHFIRAEQGTPNCVLTQCGSDITPTAVRVTDCQGHAGVSFVNGQMMSGIEVEKTNTGPVKFTACGFWGIEKVTETHASIEGRGHVTFDNCHFIAWARKKPGLPAIHARSGGLTVSACDFNFSAAEKNIEIESEVQAAVIVGNRFRGGEKIINKAGDRAQIGLNVVT